MVGGKRTDRTIVMGDSIVMVMESSSQYREENTNKQERKKLLVHIVHITIIWHRVNPVNLVGLRGGLKYRSP